MSVTVQKTCKCGNVFYPRKADVARGWGKFCSKSCKAKDQTKRTKISGRDDRATGLTVQEMASGRYNKMPWELQGVSKETFLYYADKYGGYPVFDRKGNYEGFLDGGFDNTQDCQNSDPNEGGSKWLT